MRYRTALLATIVSARFVLAQTAPIEIRGAPTCPACRILVGAPLQLNADGAADIPNAPNAVARDHRGFVYLLHEGSDAGPMIFDSTGRHVKTIGRQGGGPGEYRFANGLVVDRFDSIHVFDGRARLRTVLSPAPSWTYVRRGVSPAPMHATLLRNGRIAVAGNVGASVPPGQPIHLAGADGLIKLSFGAPTPLSPNDPPVIYERVLASADSGLWSAGIVRYRLEKWSASGTLVATLDRVAEWFPPLTSRKIATAEEPPSPEIAAIQVDGQALLWVLIVRAGKNWKSGVGQPGVNVGGRTGWARLDRVPQLLYESVIEVIDPRTKSLVASTTVDGFYPFFADESHIAGYATDKDHLPLVSLRSVRLRRP